MKQRSESQLWAMFSKFIRARDADFRGYCRCISCSTIKNYRQMDAGHYISVGSDKALKYNEMNVNAQCRSCNSFKSGNLIDYRSGLKVKYGEEKVTALEASHYMKTTHRKLNQLEINAMYEHYKQEYAKLCQTKCL